jgi:hypothetical protein
LIDLQTPDAFKSSQPHTLAFLFLNQTFIPHAHQRQTMDGNQGNVPKRSSAVRDVFR